MSHWQKPHPEPVIDTGIVDLWLFHLNIAQPQIKQFYPLLSQEEKQRSERLVNFIHRKRMIASQGFLRSVLASYLKQPAETLKFRRAERGKPSLDSVSTYPDLQFNLSHSHNLAILAVARQQELGIDIEYMQKKHNWKKIVHRFFTESEQQAINRLPEEHQKQAFYQVWTRKEAHMKVTGLGLHLAPGHFTVTVPPQDAAFIENHKQPSKAQWFMQDLNLPETFDDYRGCLSSDQPIEQLRQYLFS